MLGTTKLCNITDSEDVFVSANIFSISFYQHTLQRRITSQYLPPSPRKFGNTSSTQKVPRLGKGVFVCSTLTVTVAAPRFPRVGVHRIPSFGQRTEFRCSRVRKTTVVPKPRGGNQLGVGDPSNRWENSP